MVADLGAKPSATDPGDRAGVRVRRRRLFYVAGFDPASPRKYHALFIEQSARQGELTGARFAVGPMEPRGELATAWTVQAEHADGARVEVDYVFLHWFDIVRSVWPKDGAALYLAAWRALIDYYRSGIMRLALKQARVVYITALSPVVVGSAYLLLCAIAVAALASAGAITALALGWPWPIGTAPPLLLLLGTPWLWRRLDKLLPVGWIGRGMVCMTAAARGEIPALDARAEAFAHQLVEALGEPGWDEILVVGHSMGGQLACGALGKALQLDTAMGDGRVSLLTLGSLIPLYSMTSHDPVFWRDLRTLKQAAGVFWLDITSPSDPGSTGAIHPLAGLGLGEPEDRPVRRSPRFHLLMPESYRRLRQDPLGFPFQYLMATERSGGYDYFRLTAGPDRLTADESP